jgi:hypothetical protein
MVEPRPHFVHMIVFRSIGIFVMAARSLEECSAHAFDLE